MLWRMNARRLLLVVLVASACAATGGTGSAGAAARPIPTLVPDTQLTGAGAFMGPVHTVGVNGVRLGYRQFGSGPDLLMVTGDTAPMSLWMPYLLQPLARAFRVTIFDNRGMGYSTDDPAVRLSVPLMARDTAGLIAALGLRDTTVVGWSMGGEIAITMAALHITGAAALGRIVSSGGDAGSSHTVQPPPGLLGQLADPATSTAAALQLMFPPSPAGQAAQSRFVAGFLAVPQETPSAEILRRQQDAEIAFYRSRRVWNRLGAIRVPTLITNGELDPGVPVANARALARRIPGARLSIYAGASHGMMFQNASKFAAEVRRFARSTTR
ncbi:MAG: alpha/beta hydrolase fold protein [Solirubrobacterales bacterium]|nr:alpha/beta hydrolase fold protein [Solirubrobacterales bacterium]